MSHIKSLAVSKLGRRQIHPSQPPKTIRHAHRPRQTKKKALPVPPWDNTVNDLEVHKASPEEINRRQELRKSKNVDLVKWEEQEKAIQRACKNKVPTSVEKRKAHLLREILYDDSQLQDVLDKSDKMLTVVRDLYGDELRHKYKARPKITPAPSLEKSSAKVLNEWPPDEEVSDDATPINAEVTDSSFSTEEKENVDVEFTNTQFQGARRKVKDEGPYAMNDTAKVKKHISRLKQAYNSESDTASVTSLGNLKHVISDLEREVAQFEEESGKGGGGDKSEGKEGGRGESRASAVDSLSGYTSLLLELLTKLVRHLKEGHAELKQEATRRQQLEVYVEEQSIFLSEMAVDVIQGQENLVMLAHDYTAYKATTDARLLHLEQHTAPFPQPSAADSSPSPDFGAESGEWGAAGGVQPRAGEDAVVMTTEQLDVMFRNMLQSRCAAHGGAARYDDDIVAPPVPAAAASAAALHGHADSVDELQLTPTKESESSGLADPEGFFRIRENARPRVPDVGPQASRGWPGNAAASLDARRPDPPLVQPRRVAWPPRDPDEDISTSASRTEESSAVAAATASSSRGGSGSEVRGARLSHAAPPTGAPRVSSTAPSSGAHWQSSAAPPTLGADPSPSAHPATLLAAEAIRDKIELLRRYYGPPSPTITTRSAHAGKESPPLPGALITTADIHSRTLDLRTQLLQGGEAASEPGGSAARMEAAMQETAQRLAPVAREGGKAGVQMISAQIDALRRQQLDAQGKLKPAATSSVVPSSIMNARKSVRFAPHENYASETQQEGEAVAAVSAASTPTSSVRNTSLSPGLSPIPEGKGQATRNVAFKVGL